jgi:hypothetical protein
MREPKTLEIKGDKYVVLDIITIINGYYIFYYTNNRNCLYWNKYAVVESQKHIYKDDNEIILFAIQNTHNEEMAITEDMYDELIYMFGLDYTNELKTRLRKKIIQNLLDD